MRRILFTGILLNLILTAWGQGGTETLTGKVSFISSQNIYVKFASTSGILPGDTLFITDADALIPSLIVINLSSTSCLCKELNTTELATGHLIIARARIKSSGTDEKIPGKDITQNQTVERPPDSTETRTFPGKGKQHIKGSITLNSYSDFSGSEVPSGQRFRYSLSLSAGNIAESDFSFQTYISFKHRTGEWESIRNNIFNGLKIYSFLISYDPGKSTHISFGRGINSRISNIGSVDGLQFEQSIGKFSLGAVAGLRPDYSDYGFNTDLLQYGGFVSFDTRLHNGFVNTSVAFMQQTNKGRTDRRFLYFQHSNTILKNLFILSTLEADLYKVINDIPKPAFDLTSAFISIRYQATKRFTVSGSYDARKNVMYYETYKSFIDRILETERRQGVRMDASYRITNKMILGVQTGYRFMKSDPQPSENAGGYFTYTKIPGLNMSVTLSGTWLRTNYMDGITGGIRFSGNYLEGKIQTGFGYQYISYILSESSQKLSQNVGDVSLSVQIGKNLFLGADYEGTIEKNNYLNRLYLQIRFRF